MVFLPVTCSRSTLRVDGNRLSRLAPPPWKADVRVPRTVRQSLTRRVNAKLRKVRYRTDWKIMKALAEQIAELDGVEIYGRVVGVRGLMVEVAGPIHAMSVGARVIIETGAARPIPCEVVGFTGPNALLMPFAPL